MYGVNVFCGFILFVFVSQDCILFEIVLYSFFYLLFDSIRLYSIQNDLLIIEKCVKFNLLYVLS